MTNSYEQQVEKVARAMCDAELWVGAWQKANDSERASYVLMAEAAIAALSKDTAPAPAISGGIEAMAKDFASRCGWVEQATGFRRVHIDDLEQAFKAFAAALAAADRSAAAPAKCERCDGHGLIGGFINAESGYDAEPCPDCAAAPALQQDRRADNTGLDDGPWLPGHEPRKKPEPKSPEEMAEIRAKAWATRRAAPAPQQGEDTP